MRPGLRGRRSCRPFRCRDRNNVQLTELSPARCGVSACRRNVRIRLSSVESVGRLCGGLDVSCDQDRRGRHGRARPRRLSRKHDSGHQPASGGCRGHCGTLEASAILFFAYTLPRSSQQPGRCEAARQRLHSRSWSTTRFANAAALRMPRAAKLYRDSIPLIGFASCTLLALSLTTPVLVTGLGILLVGFFIRWLVRSRG